MLSGMHGHCSGPGLAAPGKNKLIHVARAAVCMTGSIQPEVLRDALGRKNFENGLAARLLLAMPPRARKRWTEQEVQRLLDNSPAVYKPIWFVFLMTGLRHGELAELRWGDVDLNRAEIHVRPDIAKTGKGGRIPMGEELVEVLAELKPLDATDGDFIFTNRRGNPWRCNLLKRFQCCLRLAQIDPDGVCIHSLRYTFVTSLLRAGGEHQREFRPRLARRGRARV